MKNWKITYSLPVYTGTMLLILTLLPFISLAQISDDFSDGNFTAAPSWNGSDTDFIVNTSAQLQLNSFGSSASYLTLANTQSVNNCEWSFWIRLNFAPSSSNYARVYLVSDKNNLSASLNGYYLQFGENLANDQVELFKQSGSSTSSVCRGTTNISAAFSIHVKVTRDSVGLWKLFVDPVGGNNYVQEASGLENTFKLTTYFGVYCKYTTSNATNFFFDDFYIYSPPDLTPAKLDSVKVLSQNKIDAFFSEALSLVSAQTIANYAINNSIGFASTAVQDVSNPGLVHLTFAKDFVSGQFYFLNVTGVQDLAGNNTINEAQQFYFFRPQPRDLLINEVLFDPFDNGVEWIEIYNRSSNFVELKDVFFCSRDKYGNLSEIKQIAPAGYVLSPQQYVVLSKNANAIKAQYQTENSTGFIDMASIPSLNNDSDKIILMDAAQLIIDELHYYPDWHLPLLNDTKGISLERVNYENATQDPNNWHSASETVGGATPAYQNSQYTNGEHESELTISPQVFSPDNDGYNDILSISYEFDTPSMIGNVKIFDSRGRLEKTLVQNELLATSGTFYWDGITDDKLKARIGIYIIYFEAFSSDGKIKKLKKTCVLGGKL